MALQLNLATSPIGIALPAAYARVVSFSGTKVTTMAQVVFYTTSDAAGSNADSIDIQSYQLSTAALTGDLIPAIYAALKALPEFAGAVNV